ncbi:DUF6456 domain-containing protein [Mesorhizobium sp. LHD-90]|uniref:DUF6456 domain-containing protein n=1 Tax=Mesorhizobium sp. LHD-90 TaxID=3071414 RepID=UPI0027DFA22B|nr:DUF6456 domain-containing protein [Mesorhizobium sp. LHD-90]MDQ6436855.1 DUF6456 domain-containing protein [Mesorhizobium sp. LHD-90]
MTNCDGQQKMTVRVLSLLGGGPATVEPAVGDDTALLRNDTGALSVDGVVLRRMASGGSIVRRGRSVMITAAGRMALARCADAGDAGDAFQRQHRHIETAPVPSGDGYSVAAEINLAESPLAQLMRLKAKGGRRFLTSAEFEAGERLRSDYTRGHIMQRLGANWEADVADGRRGDTNGIADLTDAALAARQRVDLALKAVGPELSGLLVDVCCFLKGLETVERERGWPARSAKMLLKTALGMLARHYYPPAKSRAQAMFHWGAEGFRPDLNAQG